MKQVYDADEGGGKGLWVTVSTKSYEGKEPAVGVIHTSVTVRNMADPDREWEGVFLVDTGASDTLVPRPYLEAIGLEPRGRRLYELADGTRVAMEYTNCEMEIMGELVGAMVVYGEPDTEPLLGVIALEAAGVRIDLRNQTLHKMPSIRL